MKYYTQFSYPAEFQGTEFQANRVIEAHNKLIDSLPGNDKMIRKIEVSVLCDIHSKTINQMLSYETTT